MSIKYDIALGNAHRISECRNRTGILCIAEHFSTCIAVNFISGLHTNQPIYNTQTELDVIAFS